MKKVRCFFAIVALVATLGGFSVQGIGAGSLANAAASQHTSTISSQMALKIYDPCPMGGEMDC